MLPMGRQVSAARSPGFDARYSTLRDAGERPAAHAGSVSQERLSLAERIEQALLEAERLHGD